MTRLRITVRTLSPLYAGSLKPYGSFLETKLEIPGSLLRGEVARLTLGECKRPEELRRNHEACPDREACPFYRLTVGVRFPTCGYSSGFIPTEPPLRTMATCKAAPGFRTGHRGEGEGHGVLDTLLHHLAFGEARSRGLEPSKLPPAECTNCKGALEPFTGRYVRERGGRYYGVRRPDTHRMTHVGMNRRRQGAEAGFLFSVQAITEGATFVGEMVLPESWDDARVQELKDVLGRITHLGGERTYGLGKVKVDVEEVEELGEDVLSRVSAFNDVLREVWGEYARGGAPEGTYFSVDLLTPAILSMPDGTLTVQLTKEMLEEMAGELGFTKLPKLEEVGWEDDGGIFRPLMFSSPVVVGGWSDAWGLPKPTSMAADAGSVYVFKTDDIEGWADALEMIEAHGIGDRREEGFGAVRICDPFHREVRQV